MYWRLHEAHVPVELSVSEGMWHGFMNFPDVPEAIAARKAAQDFLSDHLHELPRDSRRSDRTTYPVCAPPSAAPPPRPASRSARRATPRAKDGTDNVTLENFAVTSAYAASKSMPQSSFIDRDWNFDMYGTVDKSQTFHKKHLDSNTHGNTATSMAVRTDK
jgi:hypothetical protein